MGVDPGDSFISSGDGAVAGEHGNIGDDAVGAGQGKEQVFFEIHSDASVQRDASSQEHASEGSLGRKSEIDASEDQLIESERVEGIPSQLQVRRAENHGVVIDDPIEAQEEREELWSQWHLPAKSTSEARANPSKEKIEDEGIHD